MKKVFITVSDYNPKAILELESKGFSIDISKNNNDYELKTILKDYDALIIGISDHIKKSDIDKNVKCKFIGSLSVGLDHLSEIENNPKITIKNIEGYNSQSVAEFIFGQAISLSRGIYLSRFSGNNRPKGKKLELRGKTMGIIGAGNIGKKVLNLSTAFNMTVLIHTKNPHKHTELQKKNVKFVMKKDLFRKSDIVVLTVPANKDTENFASKEEIELLSKNSIFISISRESTTDVNYLIDRVKKGLLLGVALDIDNPNSYKNIDDYNILLTPHLAGISSDANDRADFTMAKALTNFFDN